MTPNDPRLLDVTFLTFAGLMAKKRQAEPPTRVVHVRILYEAGPNGEPPEWGESYTYYLPAKTP